MFTTVSSAPTVSDDRFTWTDTGLALGLVAWLAGTDLIDWFEDQWVFGAGLVLLPLLAGLLALAVRLTGAAIRRRWRRAGSVLAGVALAVLADFIFQNFGGTDRLRFEAHRGHWEALLASRAHAGAQRVAAATWRDRGGAGVVNTIDTLVYDESDEIARPAALRSPEWRRLSLDPHVASFVQVEHEDPTVTSVRHVTGHFYIAEEVYP